MSENKGGDLAAITAQPLTVSLQGKSYKMARPTIKILGEMEQAIKEDKINLVASILRGQGASQELIADKVIQMVSSPVGDEDWAKAMASPRYMVRFIHLCLSRYNPDMEEDFISEGLTREELQEISSVLLSIDEKNEKRVTPKRAKAAKAAK